MLLNYKNINLTSLFAGNIDNYEFNVEKANNTLNNNYEPLENSLLNIIQERCSANVLNNDEKDIILDYFSKNFDGCNLKEISYIGDEQNKNYQDWANRYNKEEVIVLISSFETNSSCNGALNPNSGYSNYNWILVRDRNGKWECIDQGY